MKTDNHSRQPQQVTKAATRLTATQQTFEVLDNV